MIFSAQENSLEYKKHLTISDGLAHNGVTAVLEDSNGFLWFGTYDGLNRYDGQEIKTFKNTLNSQLFISNRIRALTEDPKGNIWIGTDEGITLYYPNTAQFKNLYSNRTFNKEKKGPVVRSFILDESKNRIIATTETDGVLLFDTDYKFLKKYNLPKSYSGKVELVGAINIKPSTFLFASYRGLFESNLENGKFQRILSNEIPYCRSVTSIGENLFLVTQRNGAAIIRYEFDGTKLTYRLIKKDIFPEYRFNFAEIDPSNKLWLGTLSDGAIRFNTVSDFINETSQSYSYFNSNSGLLRVSSFKSIGNTDIWMGTFDKGVYQFDTSTNPFKTYEFSSELDFGVSNMHIRNIAKLDKNRFYLTKNEGGIALYNTETNKFEPVSLNLPLKYKSKISSIYIDKKKNTWFKVTDEGYFFLGAHAKTPHRINTSMLPKFEKDSPFKFTEDKKGNIWVACKNDVYRLKVDNRGKILKLENLNNHQLFKNNPLTLVRYVYVDPLKDFIWLGTAEDGLVRLDVSKDRPLNSLEIEQYKNNGQAKGLPSNFVSSIVRTVKGQLWIGTEGAGICEVLNDDTSPEFIPYTEKQGLSNNVVKSILVDKIDNLWVATNIGLNNFSTIDKTFRKFKKEDGLPFEDFWYTAEIMGNGKLLLTGLEGFCLFSTADIPVEEELPKLQFGDFKISNKLIQPLDTINGRVLLTERPIDSSLINLNYNENIFSVELHSLHFKAPDNHRIKYKLLPVDKEWIAVSSDQKTISYSGLQPNKYSLQVSASNSVGEWTVPKTLFITIAPPYWKTTQAYILYTILTLLLLGTVFFYILKMQKLRHNIEIEKLEKDAEKTINEAKLRFFANISHELKTPLNLISSPIRLLSNKFKGNQDIEEKLNIVERQSRKISQLIDQVNDFERVDANVMEMDYSRFYFDSFLKDMLVDFHFLAENTKRELEVLADNSNIVVSADRNKLEKIFNNLLSNAFKYSDAGDKIRVSYSASEKDLNVTISDTGRGIDKEDLPHIFERFFRSKKNQNIHAVGSGIGLAFSKRLVEMHYGYIEAESELKMGTTINVRLPVVKKESALDQETRKREILSAENNVFDVNQWFQNAENTPIEIPNDYADKIIYYVEDNVDMQMYVSGILSDHFKVKVFGNGAECLEAMDEQWPDILISDIQMPIMDGLELCKRVKVDIKTSHIPVILLTALANIESRIQGIKDGADAYIQKPFDARQLVTRTVALLENRKRLRERFEIGLPMVKDNNINNRNDDAFLEKLYNLMTENLSNEDLDIDEFARNLFMNRTHFYQKVKSLTNNTPFELLKLFRLRKAAELLAQDKKMSVSEVCVMTGFKSRTHFSKLFKEKYHVSPGKFVATQLSNN
ncbi:ATP-binding protein [Cellulophaga baltica]|uniref:hybrid sensor histidine kinase/response regulator transcription factor n=1 Tax=Cellulophaga baltica TaxID=76594 RepID=UPI0021484D4B|nr:hybrid sensor histidine kinase/response regulator transcription factor [Cellulophaga baltica]MCR1024659.1 ATP-binding protein [Cellulophaga baltica]